MELSQFTDFSLRTLIYVGLKGDELSSIDEIATAYGISKNHLVKVVHKLSQQEYLETFRGRGGGIRLGKSPEEINIGTLVRKMENLALVECFPGGKGTCCIRGVCQLQTVLHRAQNAFLKELDGTHLADLLVVNAPELRERLGVGQG